MVALQQYLTLQPKIILILLSFSLLQVSAVVQTNLNARWFWNPTQIKIKFIEITSLVRQSFYVSLILDKLIFYLCCLSIVKSLISEEGWLMMKTGANLDPDSGSKWTPLQSAAYVGRDEILVALLDAGGRICTVH